MTTAVDHLHLAYGLTVAQIGYLRFIVEYARDHNGNSPGLRELARQFGVHHSTARGHIMELSNKRLVRIQDSKIIVEESVWESPPYFLD